MKAIAASPSDPLPAQAILVERTTPASWWEQALVAVWIYCTFIVFEGNTYVMYAAAAVFLALFWIHRETTFPVARRGWILLLVPVLGVFSAAWSPAPSEAFRAGGMMVLHFIIITVTVCRLNRQQIVRALFFAGIWGLYNAAPYMEFFANGGPYDSKNIFAIRMLIITLASLAVALDSHENFLLRLAALCASGIGFYFVTLADSATAIVLVIVGCALLVAVWLVWHPVSRIPFARGFVLIGGFTALTLVALLLVARPELNLIDRFLDAVGKDATLTNRTIFWDFGRRVAEERPWLGLGLEGFWRYEVSTAQTINEIDFKPVGARHSFHSSYLEMRVHLGWVGFLFFCSAIAWAYQRTFRSWLSGKEMATSFFLVASSVILASTFTESYMTLVFDTLVFIYYAAAMSTLAIPYHEGKRRLVTLSTS